MEVEVGPNAVGFIMRAPNRQVLQAWLTAILFGLLALGQMVWLEEIKFMSG